jgi:hypothetical protein
MTTFNSEILNHVIRKKINIIRKWKVGDDVKNNDKTPIGEIVCLREAELYNYLICFL